MKVVCDREKLSEALQVVQRAVSVKSPLPILSGIKFEAENEIVFLTATDLDTGIRCSFPAEVLEQGAAVIPAKVITELIRRLPDVPIFIEMDQLKGSMTIKYGQSEATINGYPVEEYPEFPISEGETSFSLSAGLLKEVVRQVVFAAGSDENRPVFTGVLFEISGGRIEVVATDTHRLAWRGVPLKNSEDLEIYIIIPGKILGELARILGGPDQEVKVTVTKNRVVFNMGDTCLTSRLIEGQFPHYRQVIPSESVSSIRLKVKDLAEAVDRAAILTKEGSPILKMNFKNNTMIISVNTEAGRMHEELAIYQEGEPQQFAFNARYLSDILKVVGSEEVKLEFTGPLSPVIIKPEGEIEYISLLLPVRLRDE